MSTLEQRRNMADNGMCPYCGRGPFVVVVSHATRQHGVTRFEFRDDLELPYHYPLTDPWFHEHKAEQARQQQASGTLRVGNKRDVTAAPRRSVAGHKHMSKLHQQAALQYSVDSANLTAQHMAGATTQQIADNLGISRSAARSRLQRAKEKRNLGNRR